LLILITAPFIIAIIYTIAKPLTGKESKSKGLSIVIIGAVGLLVSIFIVPAISIFSFGTIPLISLLCLVLGLVKLIRVNIKKTIK
jgi:hypothetical protein